MFAGIKVAHPSCQIRCATACNFFHTIIDPNDAGIVSKNLILGSIDRLWVYGLNTTTTTTSATTGSASVEDDEDYVHVFVECLAEYPLQGKLIDIGWLPLLPVLNRDSRTPRDSLVLAFADAKISIVAYDPLLHDLRTISMHYFENDYEGAQESRQFWPEQSLMVRADTVHGRFIVGQIYDTKLFVIACSSDITNGTPLATLLASSQTNSENNNRLTGPVPANQMPSIIIDCSRAVSTERISNIVDLQIIPSERPTIVMLCHRESSGMMTDSRVGVRWPDSCLLVVAQIDYLNKSLRPIWIMPRLPSDCCRVACVPQPLSGFLIMSHSIVAWVNQGVAPYAVGINNTGRAVPAPAAPGTAPLPAASLVVAQSTTDTAAIAGSSQKLNTTFINAHCEFLEHDKVLIGSNSGQLYVLTLVYDEQSNVCMMMHWQYVGMSTATCAMTTVFGEYVFIGSRLGDSLLMRCTAAQHDEELQFAIDKVLHAGGAKRAPILDNFPAPPVAAIAAAAVAEPELDEIYGDTLLPVKQQHTTTRDNIRKNDAFDANRRSKQQICRMKTFTFAEQDTLPTYGPFTDATFAELPTAGGDVASRFIRKTLDRSMELVTTSGCNANGMLCVFRQSIRPLIQASVAVHRASDVWYVPSTTSGVAAFLLVTVAGYRTAVYRVCISIAGKQQQQQQSNNNPTNKLQQNSAANYSLSGVTLNEVEKQSAFIQDEATLYARAIVSGNNNNDDAVTSNVIQITASKVVLITSADQTRSPPPPSPAPASATADDEKNVDEKQKQQSDDAVETIRSEVILWEVSSNINKVAEVEKKPSSTVVAGAGSAAAAATVSAAAAAAPVTVVGAAAAARSIPTLGGGVSSLSSHQIPTLNTASTAAATKAAEKVPPPCVATAAAASETSARAAYCHPYVVVQSTRGRIKLFCLKTTSTTKRQQQQQQQKQRQPFVLEEVKNLSAALNVGDASNNNDTSEAAAVNSVAIAGLYKDESGLFRFRPVKHIAPECIATAESVKARLAATPRVVLSSSSSTKAAGAAITAALSSSNSTAAVAVNGGGVSSASENAMQIDDAAAVIPPDAAVPNIPVPADVESVIDEDAFLYGNLTSNSSAVAASDADSRRRHRSSSSGGAATAENTAKRFKPDNDIDYYADNDDNDQRYRHYSNNINKQYDADEATTRLHNHLRKSHAAKSSSSPAEAATVWLYTVDSRTGLLRIYSLPDFQLAFTSSYSLHLGTRVIHEAAVLRDAGIFPPTPYAANSEMPPKFRDCIIIGLGVRQSRPYLVYVLDEDVLVYEIYPYYYKHQHHHRQQQQRALQIAMHRVDSSSTFATPLMTRRRVLKLRNSKHDTAQLYVKGAPGWCQLRPFVGFGRRRQQQQQQRRSVDSFGYDGVFVCSHAPHWLMSSARGGMRQHPMDADGRIVAFTPISINSNFAEGKGAIMAYAYINGREEVRVVAFDQTFTYDNYWPVKRIPMPFALPLMPPPPPAAAANVAGDEQPPAAVVAAPTAGGDDAAVMQRQREMPEFIAYLASQRVYAVVHYAVRPVLKILYPSTGVVPNEDKIVESVERPAGALLPNDRQYSVTLLQLRAAPPLPVMLSEDSDEKNFAAESHYKFFNNQPQQQEFVLQEYEQVMVAKAVVLNSDANMSGKSEYLVLGTVYGYGEDLQCRGRIILLDVISTAATAAVVDADVKQQSPAPAQQYRLRVVCAEEQKGPVTALCGLHSTGDLCGCVGQRAYVWQLRGGRLIGRAMCDVDVYPCDMQSIKSMVCVADAYTSLTLLQYQAEFRTLGLVARDKSGCGGGGAAGSGSGGGQGALTRQRLNKVEVCVDGSQVAFLVGNELGDLMTMSYEPEQTSAVQGSTLAVRSEFHLGSHCNAMLRVRARAWDSTNDRPSLTIYQKRHVVYCFTTSGAISCFVPCTERTYRRLVMLQTLISNHCEARAGLNAREYRKCRSVRPVELAARAPQRRPTADLNLALFYMALDADERRELAKKVGCSVDNIVEELTDLTRSVLIC